MAAHQKKVIDRCAVLVFLDESGFLLLPLLQRTLAPRGQTPVLRHRASQRKKVSVAAALTLSPRQGHVSLHYQSYPDQYINNVCYARFLRQLLWHDARPWVLVHDQGTMHKGDPLRKLYRDFPRLEAHWIPPYAPELNPVEYLWNFSKDKELANFAARDVAHLDARIHDCLLEIRHDQQRLRSFFTSTPLPWDELTVFF